MQAVIFCARLNLEKTIFKPENKTIYGMNNHLWCLKSYIILCSTMSKKWKNSAIEEGEGSTSYSKWREGQRDNNILFNNLWVFDGFI